MVDEVIVTPLAEVTLDWGACLNRLCCLFVCYPTEYIEIESMKDEGGTMNRFEIVETCK